MVSIAEAFFSGFSDADLFQAWLVAGTASLTTLDVARVMSVGLLSDMGMGILLTLPLAFIYLGLNEVKYGRRAGLVIEAPLRLCGCATSRSSQGLMPWLLDFKAVKKV